MTPMAGIHTPPQAKKNISPRRFDGFDEKREVEDEADEDEEEDEGVIEGDAAEAERGASERPC